MPEQQTPVIDLNPKPKIFQFTQKKLVIIALLIVFGFLLTSVGAFYLGQSTNKPTVALQKERTATKEAASVSNLKTGIYGVEVESASNIGITLESAAIDPVYEEEKKSQLEYTQKYASDSAYLQSEYFKDSVLNLKVSLKNKKTETASYSTTNFRLKDSEDNQYTANMAGDRPIVYTLNGNETTKVTLSFTVPTSEKNFKLVYENVVIVFQIP